MASPVMLHQFPLAMLTMLFSALLSTTEATSQPRLVRRADLRNLNILIEDGDTLVRGVQAASGTGGPHPGDVAFIGDGTCRCVLHVYQ